MALVTPAILNALFTAFKSEFEQGKSEAEPQFNKIASVIKSTSASNTYGWLGKFPSLAKWIGDRNIQSMKSQAYTITNDDYESTVGVDRNDIEDDNLGVYSPIFKEMGNAAAIHPDEMIFPLLAAGFTTLCYDGQNYFDVDHPVYPEADGTGVAVSTANMAEDVAYEGEAWYVLDTSKALKPLIFQERKKPNLLAMTKMDDEAVFTRKEYRYGVDCRDAAMPQALVFGSWHLLTNVH